MCGAPSSAGGAGACSTPNRDERGRGGPHLSAALFGFSKPASGVAHFVGLLIVTIAVIAMGEPLRALRFLNVCAGLDVAVAAFFVGDAPLSASLDQAALGAAVACLSIPRGPKKERYGLWDRSIV